MRLIHHFNVISEVLALLFLKNGTPMHFKIVVTYLLNQLSNISLKNVNEKNESHTLFSYQHKTDMSYKCQSTNIFIYIPVSLQKV